MMPTSSQYPPQDPSLQPIQHTTQIPVTFDTVTFDDLQTKRLRDMERRIEADTKRKRRNWKREIERMREEFLDLRPVDDIITLSDDATNDAVTVTSYERHLRISDDVVHPSGMKTAFLDYPDTGRRFKVRFNLTGFSRKDIGVTSDGETIEVRASRMVEHDDGTTIQKDYVRKVEKPPGVEHLNLKSYLTTDDILIVEAPLAPTSLDLNHVIRRSTSAGLGHHHHHHQSEAAPLNRCHSVSPSNASGSPGTPSGVTSGVKEKYGVPIFREEDGRRRMHMIVDIGTAFQPSDILVQVIKQNKILVKAKREDKSTDRMSKNKFCKEYELSEKIETHSLRGGLQGDGKLIVSALCKGHKNSVQRANSSTGTTEVELRKSEVTNVTKSSSDSIVTDKAASVTKVTGKGSDTDMQTINV